MSNKEIEGDMNQVIETASAVSALTSEDSKLLMRIRDTKSLPTDEKEQIAAGALFLRLYSRISSVQAVDVLTEYLCKFIQEREFCRLMAAHATDDSFRPLLTLISGNKEPSLAGRIMRILGAVLCTAEYEKLEKAINAVLDICLEQLRTGASQQHCITCLAYLLRSRDVRQIVVKRHAIQLLTDRVVGASEVQEQYELGFCLWMLSYCKEAIQPLLEYRVVAKCHDILKTWKREKCARIALATLLNLAKQQDFEDEHPTVLEPGQKKINIYSEMLSLGLLRSLQVQVKKSWNDEDVVPMLEKLTTKLEQRIEDVTSFADYKQEVQSGRLEWSPVHKSEKFWKENIKEFEADNWAILRELADVLSTSQNPTVLCVAIHDFGEFVRFHPQGRKVVNALNIKPKIIAMLDTPANEEIYKEALLCTQKLLVKNWEFLGS